MDIRIVQAFDAYDNGVKGHHPAGERLSIDDGVARSWIDKGLAVEEQPTPPWEDDEPAEIVDETPAKPKRRFPLRRSAPDDE